MRTLFIILCLTLFPVWTWGQFNPTDPDEPSSLPPTANFWAEVYMNKVKCHNSSERGTRYSWDFGDGTISKEKSPVHVYQEPGTYTITLVVKNGMGEVSTSSAIEISSEENWMLEGSLTLDKYSSDIRNYTTLDDFFSDLLEMKLGYSFTLSVSGGQEFELKSIDLTERKDEIIQKIKEIGSDYFEIKGNEYNTPVLKLWSELNEKNFSAFVELSEFIQFSGLAIEFGTVRLNLDYMERMWQPEICSGGYTQEVSLSNLSSSFQYEWRLKKEPIAITGYVESGTNTIPSMHLKNNSTTVETLEYEILLKYGNEVNYTIPYEIVVLPSQIELEGVRPQNKGTVKDPDYVTISWNEAWWTDLYFDFYIWEAEGDQPVEPYSKNVGGSYVSVNHFCQKNKKYCWKVVVHTDCSDIESEIYSFSVSQSEDLEVQSVHLPGTEFLSGQRFQVKASIINIGDNATSRESWTDCLYISDQNVFNEDNALLIASVDHNGILEGGDSYEVDFSAIVPRLEGVKYLFVKTDAKQLLWDEINKENNVLISDPIVITLTDLERIENTIPVNQEIVSSEVVDFSWKGSLSSSKYELYLWLAGEERPNVPLVKNISAVRYTVSDFCKFGNSYVWQVVGVDEYGIPMSEGPQNTFVIKEAPDLHVTNIECGEAWSGQPLDISWTVRNDGRGETGNTGWSDNVWLVPDLSKGISARPIMTVDNEKALSPNESYSRTVKVSIDERTAGSYYIVVAADMNTVNSIDWSSVGSDIPDPYTPNISGDPYSFLKGYSGIGNLMEAGERGGYSDNFFYKKIEIRVSDLPDLQVKSVIPPTNPSIAGQRAQIAATIINAGKKAVDQTAWYDEIFISPTNEFNVATAKSLDRIRHKGSLEVDGEYTVTFDVKIPAGTKDGSYYFFVKTDVDDEVYEHALSGNNMTVSEKEYRVINESIYEIKATSLNVPQKEVGWAAFLEIQGKGHNIGMMETDVFAWADYVYASKNGDKLDESAVFLGEIAHYGKVKKNEEYEIEGTVPIDRLEPGEYYIYLVVNGNGGVADNEPDNNVIRSESTVKVTYPDLSVSNLSVPAVLNAGCYYPISYTIHNTGSDIENYDITDLIELHDKNDDLVKTLKTSHGVSLKQGVSAVYETQLYVPVLPADGEYVLSVYANGKGNLQETSMENNVSEKKSVRYTRYKTDGNGDPLYDVDGNLLKEPILDLSLCSVNVPTTEVATSTEFLVNWMIENVGDATNVDWYTIIYAKQGNERSLLKQVEGKKMEKNGLYHGETSISIPDNYASATHLEFEIWMGGYMLDGNSENNYTAVPISVKASPLPDLKLKNVQCSPLIAGNKATLTYEVENTGVGETRVSEWVDYVYLTGNISPDQAVASKLIQKTLSPGDSYRESISFTVPKGYDGNYNLFLKVDNYDAVYEGDNEENNIEQQFVTVVSPSANPTDLIIEKVLAPNSYVAGEQISISWTVRNGEQYPASGTLKDAIYLSEDQEWDESDLLVGTVSGTVSLQAGGSVERVATGIINSAVPGSYYVIIRTNQLNSILESDYQNNAMASTAICQVDFKELAIGSSVQVDGQGFFKLAADKGESLLLHLEADGTEKGFNLYMAHDRVATVTEYDYISAQPNDPYQEILVPEMEMGTYYILAQQREFVSGVENNFTLGEGSSEAERMQMTLSSQLLQFGISRMDKPEGGNGGSATSRVLGAKFDSIMDYRLKRDNRILPAEAIYFQNSSEALVTFDLDEEALGTYDVIVEKNGGVKSEMKSGYTVVQDSPNKLLTRIVASSSFRSGTTNPVTIEYANDGLSDVVVSELLLVSENGHPIGMTAKEVEKEATELRIPIVDPGTNQPMSVAPGGKGSFTVYIYAGSTETVSLQLYVIE
ncbi:CARDB domain-containing protein [Parabacteroides johnsonii]